MGYVAVRGGGKAIEESLKLLEYQRVSASSAWGTDEIEGTFPELVDQVMGEASLYAPRLAALALKQAQGSPDEAVFLLRAFRSTLERPYVSRPVDTGAMRVNRRVSAAFKDVPGGQLLGATRDYSHRLLAFDLETEGIGELAEKRAELARHFADAADAPAPATTLPRVLDYLRAQGLVARVPADDVQPVDATMVPLTFPAPRSVRLQTLARGMTQAVEALGYASARRIPRWASCGRAAWPWPWTIRSSRAARTMPTTWARFPSPRWRACSWTRAAPVRTASRSPWATVA